MIDLALNISVDPIVNGNRRSSGQQLNVHLGDLSQFISEAALDPIRTQVRQLEISLARSESMVIKYQAQCEDADRQLKWYDTQMKRLRRKVWWRRIGVKP